MLPLVFFLLFVIHGASSECVDVFPHALDVGIYWAHVDETDAITWHKSCPDAISPVFDPARESIVYFHGLQPGSVVERHRFFIDDRELDDYVRAERLLGRNIGVFQWVQLADEPLSNFIRAEAKIKSVDYVGGTEYLYIASDGSAKFADGPLISVADLVEKRPNLVQLMRALTKEVMNWGEKLVFTGVKDDTLPPKVLNSLDNYLAESGSKLLVIQPLKDEREEKTNLPIRSAIIMECFDPPTDAQQLVARLDVVGRHCTSALYNAIEHRRIPMRWLWLPIVKFQEGLGGQKKAIMAAASAGIVLLVSVLILVPYPLKMEATGQLQPEVRRKIFPATEGIIREIRVGPGATIPENTNLGVMHDGQLEREIRGFRKEIQLAAAAMVMYEQRASKGNESDKLQSHTEAEKTRILRDAKEKELQALLARTNGDPVPQREGTFYLRAPFFNSTEAALVGEKRSWTVLSTNFKEDLTERAVKPTDELLRLGAVNGPWEIETKIPQQNIGHILKAYRDLNSEVLDVEFILRADSSRKFHGKLRRDRIGGEAMPMGNDQEHPDPMVTAFVTITKEDLDKLRKDNLLVSGTEIRAKVRCGNKPMGYSLFYGVWEFFYEKVVFFF